MTTTKLLRETYPRALNGLFFKGNTEEEVYNRFLNALGQRVPTQTKLTGIACILHHADHRRDGRPRDVDWASVKMLAQCYNDTSFRDLLRYLVMHTGYGHDDQALREHLLRCEVTEAESIVTGRLTALLQSYLGSDYVMAGETRHRFARALAHLAGGSGGMPYPELVAALISNVSMAVLPHVVRWDKGMAPDWEAILRHTEAHYGQAKVHEALAEVGLRKPIPAKTSPFRQALITRLTADQRRTLCHDDIELGRRLLNNMCKYWGVQRPKRFVHDHTFLEVYLRECDLLPRLPVRIADVLMEFTRCKPAQRDWTFFFTLLDDCCSQPLWMLVQENAQDRNEDTHMLQERLMQYEELMTKETKRKLLHGSFASPLMPADLQIQYYADAAGRIHMDTETYRTPVADYKVAPPPSAPTVKDSFGRILDKYTADNRKPSTPSPALAMGVRMHEALEKEMTKMPTITDQKNSPLKNTANKIKEAVQHGTAVASADEMANAGLMSIAEVIPEIQPLLQTEFGRTIIKLGLGSLIIGAVEHDFVPLDNTDHLEKGATLVVEAAARDGLQPLMAKLTPVLVKLAAAGKKAFEEAAK